MDAIEEVTVTGATPDAASGAQGSVQIAFATRSGTQPLRRQRLPLLPNAGAQHQLLLQRDQQPAEERDHGPPVRRPRRRADQAAARRSSSSTTSASTCRTRRRATRTILHAAGDDRRVPLRRRRRRSARSTCSRWRRAAGNSPRSIPTIGPLLTSIRSATAANAGTILTTTNLNTQSYTFQPPSVRNEYAPTTRVDFNLTEPPPADRHVSVAAHQERRRTS